jgi:hypothetical protein
MEEQNNSVTTALYALKGEIGIVFTQLQNLTSEIGNLKEFQECIPLRNANTEEI